MDIYINDTTTINHGKRTPKGAENAELVRVVTEAGKPTQWNVADKGVITLKPCGGKGNPFMVVVDGDQTKLLESLKGQTVSLTQVQG